MKITSRDQACLYLRLTMMKENDDPVRAEDLSYIHYAHEITRKVSRILFDGSENRTRKRKQRYYSIAEFLHDVCS